MGRFVYIPKDKHTHPVFDLAVEPPRVRIFHSPRKALRFLREQDQ